MADDTVPTCGLNDRIGDLRERVRTDGRDTCVVVNEDGVVLGSLRKVALEAEDDRRAEQVMKPGPATFRPNVTLDEIVKYMREHDLKTNVLVTTAEGRLLGVIARADAEATLAHESGGDR